MSTFGGSPLTPSQIANQELQASHEGYVHKVLVGFDQWANVIAGGNPDETISSRAQRLADNGNEFAKLLSWGLDRLQANHGQKAQAGDLERAQAVQAVEDKSLGVS